MESRAPQNPGHTNTKSAEAHVNDHRQASQAYPLQSSPGLSYLPAHPQASSPQQQQLYQNHGPPPSHMYGHGAVVNTVPGGIVIDQRRFGEPREHQAPLPPVPQSSAQDHSHGAGRARDAVPQTERQRKACPPSHWAHNQDSTHHDTRNTVPYGGVARDSSRSSADSQAKIPKTADLIAMRPVRVPESPVVQCLVRILRSLEELHRKVDGVGEVGSRNAKELQGLWEEVRGMREGRKDDERRDDGNGNNGMSEEKMEGMNSGARIDTG